MEAETKSGNATTSASNASILARGARQEADTFEGDIVSAKKQAADAELKLADATERTARLEAQLSWRAVTPEQKEKLRTLLTSSSKQFMPLSGLKINFTFMNSDPEGQEYADELKDALDGLGAEISEPRGASFFGTKVLEGVIVSANSLRNPKAMWFLNALNNSGVLVTGERIDAMDAVTIDIIVGSKPRPSHP